jgi:hypothetical protein
MLTVLGGLEEFERALIRARTGEGRARAKARGVHMGRPPKLTPHQRQEALARRDAGETLSDIARTYGVAHTTMARLWLDAMFPFTDIVPANDQSVERLARLAWAFGREGSDWVWERRDGGRAAFSFKDAEHLAKFRLWRDFFAH